MLYIVDGTGEYFNETYQRSMKNGFCDRMARQLVGYYYRGPSTPGVETYFTADEVYKEIKQNPRFGKEPLFLAGHSRGGAAVINVAQQLKAQGHVVNAMFLFDAVDRTLSKKDVQLIPRNVKVTYHARRDTSIKNYFESGQREATARYLQCVASPAGTANPSVCEPQRQMAEKYTRLDDAMKVRMRASWHGLSINFGNCGVGLEPACNVAEMACKYIEKTFLGSHGALGGSPIGEQDGAWASDNDQRLFKIIKENDRAAMSSVWSWMCENFEEQKLSSSHVLSPQARRLMGVPGR